MIIVLKKVGSLYSVADSKIKNCASQTIHIILFFQGLLNNSNEAKRRLKIEEEEYVNQVVRQCFFPLLKSL